MSEPKSRWPEWRRQSVLAAIVFLVAFAVFANSLGNGFVYDDIGMIRDNPRLESPWNVGAFFSTSYWGDRVEGASLYRPLTIMSFAVDRAIFGPGPFGVHLMNVLANALLAALVHLTLFSLLRRQDVAFVTALVFAIHPVHTEVIANGVGRAELYAGVFMLSGALLHLHYLRLAGGYRSVSDFGLPSTMEQSKHAKGYLIAATVFYFAAILFKESAAVLPGLLFLAEWLVLQRGKLDAMVTRLGRYLAYAPSLAVALLMRLQVVGSAPPAQQEVMVDTSGFQRLLHASETLLRYLGQLVYPMELCAEYADYTNLIKPSLTDPLVLASLVVWLAGGALVYWLVRQQQHVFLLSIVWFFLAILPVSNVVIQIGSVRADRFLFMPSLGFALAVGWGAALLASKISWRPVAVGLALILVFYGWRSVTRNLDWRSQETLWTATVRSNPGYAPGWELLGDFHRAKGDLHAAAGAYAQAYELRDAAGFFYTGAHTKRAFVLAEAGVTEEAEKEYRLVLKHEPEQPMALMNLGHLLMSDEAAMRDPATQDEVIELFQRVTRIIPEEARGHENLAQALRMADKGDEAPALAAPEDGNLLPNPSFEEGREPWFSLSGPSKPRWGDFSISDALANSGRHSAYLPLRSAGYDRAARAFGAIQDLTPDPMPRRLSGLYRVENWERGTAKQYLQIVIVVWGAANSPPDVTASNFQISYLLAGVTTDPIQVLNRRFVLVGPEEPRQGEWVPFEFDLHADFLQHWGVVPEGFEKLRILLEVRFDDRQSTDSESLADVYYDDVYLGP